jgi:hypothetical protein
MEVIDVGILIVPVGKQFAGGFPVVIVLVCIPLPVCLLRKQKQSQPCDGQQAYLYTMFVDAHFSVILTLFA